MGGIAIGADVSRSDEWTRIVSSVREQLGGLDVAHLNAGVTTGVADITELTDEQYRRIVGVNMDGVTLRCPRGLAELRSRGGGAIVATASLAGIVAFPLDAAYTMTKHAVVGLVRVARPRSRRRRHHDQRGLPRSRRHAASHRTDPRCARRIGLPSDRPGLGRRRGSRVRSRRRDRSGYRRAGGTGTDALPLRASTGTA